MLRVNRGQTSRSSMNRSFICIDLKSFYASVECRERDLDPLTTNLVVADVSRTEKTICLAVSPSMKAYGIPGRARLFEVNEKMREVNAGRRLALRGQDFSGSSCSSEELNADPGLKADFIAAVPQMAKYMQKSSEIYSVYLKYIAPEDIHVYSIDEVFMDVTAYLNTYRMTPRELAGKMLREVYRTTGITATAGIGTNLYLAKIAMDIVAKHVPADEDNLRIAELDEGSYRWLLWTHRPLMDFWRVGRSSVRKLEKFGIYTMGDIARTSLKNEDLLYKLFGVNAELLIDHAWGIEPCMITDIKAYKPDGKSLSSGQVLQCPHTADEAGLIVKEMTDLLTLDLVKKNLASSQIVLDIGYDVCNLSDPKVMENIEVVSDWYGRAVPKPAHGSMNLKNPTSSTKELVTTALKLFDRIVNRKLLIRRLTVTVNHLAEQGSDSGEKVYEQMDLFTDYKALEEQRAKEKRKQERETNMQKAALAIQKKYGRNALLKGMNLQEGATTKERNHQIGGHKECETCHLSRKQY